MHLKKCSDLFPGIKKMLRDIEKLLATTGMSTILISHTNKKGDTHSYNMNATSFSSETNQHYVKLALVPVNDLAASDKNNGVIISDFNINTTAHISNTGEDQLLKKREWIKYIATSSYDVMWDWDIRTNNIYVGESIKKVLGFNVLNNITTFDKCLKHIPEEDRKRVEDKLHTVLASQETYWKDKFQFVKADGTIASTMSRASILREEDGTPLRMIGAMQDVSKMRDLEKKLKQQSTRQKEATKLDKIKHRELEDKLADEILLKEIGIAAAIVDAQELERSDLGRELHDNVNQLLGASRLYLDMARTEQGDISVYLRRSEEYTVSAIEAIRKLSKGLTTHTISDFGLFAAIDKLVTDTMQTQAIIIHYSIDKMLEDQLNLKFKLNIFRIIQEQINNIIKHAKAKHVNIQLSKNKFSVILTIADDGIGFDNLQDIKGIGLLNIKSRSSLYNGAVTVVSHPGEGCTIKVIFPLSEILSQELHKPSVTGTNY